MVTILLLMKNQSIVLDMSGSVNVEYDVEYFNFNPNLSEISHIMGNESGYICDCKEF